MRDLVLYLTYLVLVLALNLVLYLTYLVLVLALIRLIIFIAGAGI